ncbi:MAG: glycosyltransferase [Ignavibacteria bacterium]|jgi:glycosyltransferase involved in cell wall biosynthesis
MKKKLLALYYRPPELNLPQNSYGQYHILQAAKEVFETRILSFKSPLLVEQGKSYFVPNYSFNKKISNLIFKIRSSRLTHYFTEEMFKAHKDLLYNFKPDLLYVDNLVMMQYPLAFHPNSKILFYDDESQLFIKHKKLRNGFKEFIRNIRLADFEKKALTIAEKSFCITDEETNYLKNIGYKNVQTLPYPIDNEYYFYNWNPPEDEFRILFVGDFSHPPNKEAAKIICKEIYTAIQGRGIKITLVGRNINRIQKYINDEISVFENVPDVRPFYWKSNLFVVPIFSGGGQRIKILEAAACGIPILMTSTANTGINLQSPDEFMLANSVNDMKGSILRVSKLNSLDMINMSEKAYHKVISDFALKKLRDYYIDVFSEFK